MTVAASTRLSGPYNGNGVTVAFAYGWRIEANTELRVILRDTDGEDAILTLTTDYTVSGVSVDGGGNVTLVTAPATGEKVIIEGVKPKTQTVEYTATERFPYDSHQAGIDKLLRISQELQRDLDRVPKFAHEEAAVRWPLKPTDEAQVILRDTDGKIICYPPSDIATGLNPLLIQIGAETGTGFIAIKDGLISTTRTIAAGAGIGVTNGDGDGGNPTIAITDAQLVALLGLSPADGDLIEWDSATACSVVNKNALAITATDGTSPVTTGQRASDQISIRDYGGLVDGATDDSAAVTAMVSAVGFARFPRGTTVINTNLTPAGPTYFDAGAQVSVSTTKTLTLDYEIECPYRQKIFAGAGAVLLNNGRTHQVLAEWFGCVGADTSVDNGPFIQKIFDSVVTGREIIISFDGVEYYISTGVTTSRAAKILGMGERITNFHLKRALQTSGDVFTTGGEGCTFENIQFTGTDTLAKRTSGAFINMAHPYCRAVNIRMTAGFCGILVDGDVCDVIDITAFNFADTAGSNVVRLADGSTNAYVHEITYSNSGTADVENVVLIEASLYFNVDGIHTNGAKTAVGVRPSSSTAGRGTISNVEAHGSGGTNGVVVNSTGTAAVESLKIRSVYAYDLLGIACHLKKDGSGVFKHISVEDVEGQACDVGAFAVEATSGTIDHWIARAIRGRNSGSGYGASIANANYWTLADSEMVSNGGTGVLIASTCGAFMLDAVRGVFNTTAQITDSTSTAAQKKFRACDPSMGEKVVRTKTADFSIAITDDCCVLNHTSATPHAATIPANSSVPCAIGFQVDIVNGNGAGALTLGITTDTLRWGTSTGSRTIAANSWVRLIKLTATEWRLTGEGIS